MRINLSSSTELKARGPPDAAVVIHFFNPERSCSHCRISCRCACLLFGLLFRRSGMYASIIIIQRCYCKLSAFALKRGASAVCWCLGAWVKILTRSTVGFQLILDAMIVADTPETNHRPVARVTQHCTAAREHHDDAHCLLQVLCLIEYIACAPWATIALVATS